MLRRDLSVVVELLACPLCHGELIESAEELVCSRCEHRYAMQDGTPNLLLAPCGPEGEHARGLAGRAICSVVAIPRVYDLVQRLAGAPTIFRRVEPILHEADLALVLDVGGGTGSAQTLLPSSARYVLLDSDPRKLEGFRAKSDAPAILGDATRLPFGDGSVDWALSIAVSHHLDEPSLNRMLDELRRVVTGRLLFLDAVTTERRVSRTLWRYDGGRHPRSADALLRAIAARFEVVTHEEFTVYHRYLLVTAK
jgi:uncharacterized protein YbaR (Trm112 family)